MKRHYYLILSLVAFLCSQTTFSQNCTQIGEIVPFDTFAPACDLNYAINTFDGDLLTNVTLPSTSNIGDIIKIGDIVPAYTTTCEFTGDAVTYYEANCVEPASCVEPMLADMFVTVDCIALYEPVCGCDGQTYANVCNAQAEGITSFVAGECGNNGVFCGAEEAWAIPWLQSYINDPCYETIYSFTLNGEPVVFVTATLNCLAVDIPSILFNCQGDILCYSGGFTPASEQCALQGIDLEPFLIPENIVWFDDPACCDPLPEVCGVLEIWELEWLSELIDNSNGCAVMRINQFEYNGATYFQAIPNFGSVNCPTDLPTIFYDCEGNTFCTAGFGINNCPPDLFAAANNGFTVWEFETPNNCQDNPLFTYTITGSIGTDDVPQSYGANIYCFNDNIFTDNICGWEWDFGNGETSTESDPCNVFLPYLNDAQLITTPYEVCLTVYECGNNNATTCCQEVFPFVEAPCLCPTVIIPVCGIDGNTYNNECEAACAGIPILYEGICEEPNDLNMCEVDIKMFLQGALFNTTDGLMRDDLRTNNLLPLTEPYSNSPYFTHVGGGGETTTSAVFSLSGQNAITDWVFLELRDAANNLVKTRSALLQRDGDVVEVDGVSPVNFDVSDGNYYVCVRHRNHLGTMTNSLMNISSNSMTTIDFTNIATYGTDAQMEWNNNINALWAGHTNNTGSISFQGFDNNVNGLFFEVLSTPNNPSNVANYIYDGYNEGDINMDGSTIYQGNNSDVTNIFFTTLQHPQNENYIGNFVIYQQMP